MKIAIAISAVLFVSTVQSAAQAQEIRLVSSDGSALSALCIAAARSEKPLHAAAEEHGIARSEIEEIRCNGIALQRFVSKYKARNSTSQHNFRYNIDQTRSTSSLQ